MISIFSTHVVIVGLNTKSGYISNLNFKLIATYRINLYLISIFNEEIEVKWHINYSIQFVPSYTQLILQKPIHNAQTLV